MAETLVLCYHAISPRWPAPLSVTPDALADQLHLLLARGYRAVTFAEAVPSEGEGRRFAVTFDDAYRSVVEVGYPILRDLEVPATVFVPTAYPARGEPMAWPGIDRWLGTEHESELIPASWDELRELASAGWEIGSHTHSHPRLPQLDDGALRDELERSKLECERELGVRCRSIAYPYGDHDDGVIAATGEAGYEAAATLPKGVPPPSALAFPRVGVYHRDDSTRFRLKVSRSVRALRGSPLGSALRI